MRFLRSFLLATLALVGGVASVHAEAFGIDRYTPDTLQVPVDNLIGWTDHADGTAPVSAPNVSADTSGGVQLRHLAAFAVAAILFAHGDHEAAGLGVVLANTPVALPAEVTKKFDELKANLKTVLELEGELKTVKDGQAEIKQEIANRSEKTAELIDQAKADMEKAQTDRLDEIEMELTKRFRDGGAGATKTAGQLFTESDAFTGATDRKSVGAVMVPREAATKDVTTSANQNPPNYTGEVVTPQKPRLAMRDLLPGGRSARDVIKYVRMITRALNAAGVAEGALKPESNLAFEDVSAQMKKIAHYIPVTEEQLSDIDGLQSTIDAELRYGIEKAEDNQILNGDGTGENLDGLIPNATAYDAATYGDTVANATLLDQIRGMMAQLLVGDYMGSGIVLNPIDWFKIETTKTTEGAYIFASPQNVTTPRLWGLPVVDTNQIAAADVLVADFLIAAQLFDGQLQGEYGIQLRTGQPNDFFLRNKYAVLAEERLLQTIKRPGAILYYDSDAV